MSIAAFCEECFRAPCTCVGLDASTVPTVTQGGSAADGSDASTVPTVTEGGSGEPSELMRRALDATRDWLERFIVVLDPSDLDLLTLWAGHTHFIDRLYSTPRLTITSILPASGKTTCLEHLERLTRRAINFSSLNSGAVIVRTLADEPRTLLIDEVQRNLDPKRDNVAELETVINVGYKRGATRPTLVPDGKGGWTVEELPTFAAVAMAGIAPNLPDDTRSRIVTVNLLPDHLDLAEDSDWEVINSEALDVGEQLERAALAAHLHRVDLPDGVRGRAKERWRPLWRVAHSAGGSWPEKCQQLIDIEAAALAHDREEGLMQQRPEVTLVQHLVEVWPDNEDHATTEELRQRVTSRFPDSWGVSDRYPKGLTVQRIGRMLTKLALRTDRSSSGERIGYSRDRVLDIAGRLGVTPPPHLSNRRDRRTGGTDEHTTEGENR